MKRINSERGHFHATCIGEASARFVHGHKNNSRKNQHILRENYCRCSRLLYESRRLIFLTSKSGGSVFPVEAFSMRKCAANSVEALVGEQHFLVISQNNRIPAVVDNAPKDGGLRSDTDRRLPWSQSRGHSCIAEGIVRHVKTASNA